MYTTNRSTRSTRLRRIGLFAPLLALLGAVVPLTAAYAAAPALNGIFAGSINGDLGSSAPVTVGASGTPQAVAATIDLAVGLHMDCHGNQDVGAQAVALTGYRTSVSASGASSYDLTGRFEFGSGFSHAVIDVSVIGATLSTDGQLFSGTAGLLVRPDFASNCTTQWGFTTSRVASSVVPNVVGERRLVAINQLHAAGFMVSVAGQIDRFCNDIGAVMRERPGAGTVVAAGSTVTIYIGVRPPHPCP